MSQRYFVIALMIASAVSGIGLCDSEQEAFQSPTYAIYRAGTAIKIDGRLDEPAWVAAPDMGDFHFTWYERGEKERTIAKMLWDDDYLYIAHICQDAHITARHTEHDAPIPEDDCFEVMLAPKPERPKHYFNIEWNLLGGYVDGHRTDGPEGPRVPWDAHGLHIAGTYQGTLNEDSDSDAYWIAEVAIPFSNFREEMPHTPPRPGARWNLNLNRHGGDTNMQYSQWSPGDTDTPAFHTPHRFGIVTFSKRVSPFRLSD